MTTVDDPTEAIQLSLAIVDPWDLATAVGVQLRGRLLRVDPEDGSAMLLEIHDPPVFELQDCRFFVARGRRDCDTSDVLLSGAPIDVNLVRVPTEQAMGGAPFDVSQWRGGVAAIATVQRTDV